MGDFEWKRKRRAVEEEDVDDGWMCDVEDWEETLEQESTESRESGCLRSPRCRGLLPSDLRGQGEVRGGPRSAQK